MLPTPGELKRRDRRRSATEPVCLRLPRLPISERRFVPRCRSRGEQSDDAIDEIKQLLPCFIAFTVSDSHP